MDKDEEVLKELLGESKEQQSGKKDESKKPIKAKKAEQETALKEKESSETIAFETPQTRFKKIVKDQGYNVGLENLTSIFFRGDTNDPNWLNETLILSNIPAKNRELIITSYYGTTLTDLGISVAPRTKIGTFNTITGKPNEVGLPLAKDDEFDPSKMAEKELIDMVKQEKTKTALAQLRSMRADYEESYKKKELLNQPQQQQQQQQVYTRQISRPIFREGKLVTNIDGSPMYETIVEPVNPNQQQSGISEMMPLFTTLLSKDNKPQQSSELAEMFRRFDERMAAMERNNELRAKEDQIKRLEDETKRVSEQFKRDLEQREKENKEALNKLESDRIRELKSLEERFKETIEHRKELDNIVGSISQEHKKELDAIKQQLSHAQTNIERTVVSKGTDTVDKLSGKFADIAESVIKPMASVMKDQYTLAIDQQRKASGLPLLKDSVPEVGADELNNFIKE